jgi:TIR domain
MKVFISWSGPRSRHVARALHGWLPEIVQYVEPWMSHENIQAGARWTSEINDQLSQTKFGIICLTPENQHKPWLMFEAGALAKTVDDVTFVVPYLIGMDKSEVEGPLAQFQKVLFDEEGTFGLVQSINKVPDNDAALPGERLKNVFNRSWTDLKRAFDALPDADAPMQKPRGSDEILREVLEVVRDTSRRANNFPSRDDIRASVADILSLYLAPTSSGITTQPLTQEEFNELVSFQMARRKAREEREAAKVAVREQVEASNKVAREAEEARRNAEKRVKAMRDAEEADEHHEQD